MLRSTQFFSGETSQRVGGLAALFSAWGKQGSVSYNNDWFFGGSNGDGGDRYRTMGANIKISDIEVGLNLFTGDPDLTGRRTVGSNGGYKGVYEEQNPYRSGIFYVGFRGARLGVNSESIRDFFQNTVAHNNGYRFPEFEVRNNRHSIFLQYSKSSRYTAW